jgi:hypothetical protein
MCNSVVTIKNSENLWINCFKHISSLKQCVNLWTLIRSLQYFDPAILNQSFASVIPPSVIANVASLSGKSGLQEWRVHFLFSRNSLIYTSMRKNTWKQEYPRRTHSPTRTSLYSTILCEIEIQYITLLVQGETCCKSQKGRSVIYLGMLQRSTNISLLFCY